MTALILIRLLATLRAIHRDLLKRNEIATEHLQLDKDRLALQFPAWYRAGSRVPDVPKIASIDHPTIEEWNLKSREQDPYAEERKKGP